MRADAELFHSIATWKISQANSHWPYIHIFIRNRYIIVPTFPSLLPRISATTGNPPTPTERFAILQASTAKGRLVSALGVSA